MSPTDKVNREWLRKLRTAVEDMRNPCFGSELHNQTVRDIENMLLVHVDEILASLSAERAQEPADCFVAMDIETQKQEIFDLFARYGSGDYMPTDEEKEVLSNGLDEILTPPPYAPSSVEPHDLRLATGMLEGYMRQAAAHPGDVETLIPAIGETLRRLVEHASATSPSKDEARLRWLEKVLQHCPHAELTHNDDAEEGPVGWSLAIESCSRMDLQAPTLAALIDLGMNTEPDEDGDVVARSEGRDA